MKKSKIVIILILVFVLAIIAGVFVFMNISNDNDVDVISDVYYNGEFVESINFLKLNTYEELKKYAENNPIFIQTSDNSKYFAIGEFKIEDAPVKLIYNLNDDGTLNRFDGNVSIKMSNETKDGVVDVISTLNSVIVDYFGVENFEYDIFDENGAPIDPYDDSSFELLFNGKAKYNISIIDESNTYWNISALVTDKKQIEFEFFRCFDSSVYDDDSPNIYLLESMGTGE